ncbi:DUF4129 domain-containing protein [Chryseobacterium sp. LC2016-29]|uniref:DUF4129 domain-containing protein n=1 Tax=Chryseobacterium sp. LC2016-29 TaxID=2897331 RepID=UPI001E28DD40|nr:DUF4129 domain-containing protein [Chryseobacterium sp. LC2016-29]MCD0479586.1 DUF4129 domain-containing protein [Chryseobacterium sp. LC2016-29]
MNKFLVFLLIFLNLGVLKSQEYEDDDFSEVYVEDSVVTSHYKNMYVADSILKANPQTENSVFPKKFKENLSSRYKGNEFDYSTSKPRESFFDKLQRKLAQLLRSIFGETSLETSSQITGVVIRLFAIIVVGFLLYFIIKYLISTNGSFFFGKKNKKLEINEEELHENIHQINFPQSIAKFENEGDYRSAVRYQFLYILKKLSDKKLILWNPEKTNKDYVAELKAAHLKNEFYNLSYIFDYVWYGEFSIDAQSYDKFKNQFHGFKP